MYGNELFFSKKSQPPLNIKWSVPYICTYICKHEPDELRTALTYLVTETLPSLPTLSQCQKLWKFFFQIWPTINLHLHVFKCKCLPANISN